MTPQPLTELSLAVDCRRPHWALWAAADAAGLLERAGRPAMAAELLRLMAAPGQEPLGLLARYLRLAVTPGEESPSRADSLARGGPSRRGLFPFKLQGPGREKRLLWFGEQITAPPVVAAGHLLVGGADGVLKCIDLETSAPRWQAGAGGAVTGVAVSGHRVVFGAAGGPLRCVHLIDGRQLWSYPLASGMSAAPAIVEGCVLLVCNSHYLHWVELESGRGVKRLDGLEPLYGNLAAAEGRVVARDNDKALLCFETGPAGGCSWVRQYKLTGPSDPVIAEGRVLAEADGKLRCLNMESGEELWSAPAARPPFAGVAVSACGVVLAREGQILMARSLETGEPLWRTLLGTRAIGAPSIAADAALFCSDHGGLSCVELQTGHELWCAEAPVSPLVSPVVSDCGRILMSSTHYVMSIPTRA